MYVFASDVHLSNPTDSRYQAFKTWIESLITNDKVTKVFLMGDVFDLWLGDRKIFVDKYDDIIKLIFKLAAVKEVHVFEGNHDFQMGEFWKKNGVFVQKSYYEFEDKQGKWLLTHGDLIDLEDKGYLALRKFFRSAFARFLIKILPGSLLAKIGNSINTTDQKKAPTVDERERFEVNWAKWTKLLRNRKNFDYFICGHYHFRIDFKTDSFRALNLGSWLGKDYKIISSSDGEFDFIDV